MTIPPPEGFPLPKGFFVRAVHVDENQYTFIRSVKGCGGHFERGGDTHWGEQATHNDALTWARYGCRVCGALIFDAVREHLSGPGSVTARFEYLLDELDKRFPRPLGESIRSDRTAESYYLDEIDLLLQAEELKRACGKPNKKLTVASATRNPMTIRWIRRLNWLAALVCVFGTGCMLLRHQYAYAGVLGIFVVLNVVSAWKCRF